MKIFHPKAVFIFAFYLLPFAFLLLPSLKTMPIYEYKCLDCGARIEKMRKISDEPLKICENCGGNLEKQLSLSGFQFKGEGWYVTDYAGKKSEKSAEKSEKSDKAEKSEKISSGESTAKSDTASNEKSDKTTVSSKESASKKD